MNDHQRVGPPHFTGAWLPNTPSCTSSENALKCNFYRWTIGKNKFSQVHIHFTCSNFHTRLNKVQMHVFSNTFKFCEGCKNKPNVTALSDNHIDKVAVTENFDIEKAGGWVLHLWVVFEILLSFLFLIYIYIFF